MSHGYVTENNERYVQKFTIRSELEYWTSVLLHYGRVNSQILRPTLMQLYYVARYMYQKVSSPDTKL